MATEALLRALDVQSAFTLAHAAADYVREDWRRLGYVPLGLLIAYGVFLRPHPASVRPSGAPSPSEGSHPGGADGLGGRIRVLSGLDAFRKGADGGAVPCLAAPHFALTSVGIAHGPSGEGKSRWLSEVVYAVLRGEPVFGWATRQTAVVWVTEEPLSVWRGKAQLLLPPEELAWPWWRRLLRWALPRRYPPTVWVVSLPHIGYVPSPEAFRALCGRVRRLAKRTGARLIIGDTIMALCPQAVADNTAAKVFMMEAHALAAKTGAAVELVHHDNDGGKPLGAKMLKGDADFTHHVSRLPKAREDDRRRVVTFGKRYEPFAPPPLVYEMRADGRLYEVGPRPRTDAMLQTDGPGSPVAQQSRNVAPASEHPGSPREVAGANPAGGSGAAPAPVPLPVLRVVPPLEPGRDVLCRKTLELLRSNPPPKPWTRPALRDAAVAAGICNRGTAYAHLNHLIEDKLLDLPGRVEEEATG